MSILGYARQPECAEACRRWQQAFVKDVSKCESQAQCESVLLQLQDNLKKAIDACGDAMLNMIARMIRELPSHVSMKKEDLDLMLRILNGIKDELKVCVESMKAKNTIDVNLFAECEKVAYRGIVWYDLTVNLPKKR